MCQSDIKDSRYFCKCQGAAAAAADWQQCHDLICIQFKRVCMKTKDKSKGNIKKKKKTQEKLPNTECNSLLWLPVVIGPSGFLLIIIMVAINVWCQHPKKKDPEQRKCKTQQKQKQSFKLESRSKLCWQRESQHDSTNSSYFLPLSLFLGFVCYLSVVFFFQCDANLTHLGSRLKKKNKKKKKKREKKNLSRRLGVVSLLTSFSPASSQCHKNSRPPESRSLC